MSDIRNEWEAAVLASDLSDTHKVTCWAIRSFADKSGACFPSQKTLAGTRSCTAKTISRHLKSLGDRGFIKREKGKGQSGIGGTTDLITLTVPERPDSHSDRSSTVDPNERPDNMDVPTSGDAEPEKEGTNSDERPDTECERPDKSAPKTGHHDVPQTSNHLLNQRTSAPGGARVGVEETKSEDDETSQQLNAIEFRQEVSDAVLDYGSRDAQTAWKFINARVKGGVSINEIEAAIRQHRMQGSL